MTRQRKTNTAQGYTGTARLLAVLILVLPFFFALLKWLGLAGAGKLVLDGAWGLLAVLPLVSGRVRLRRDLLPWLFLVGSFLIQTLVVYLFRWQSGFYYLWGVRNYFRFYVFFFAVAVSFRQRDGEFCLKLLDRLFWPNAAVCLLQFFLGYRQDYLGGLFGVDKGCNGYTILYFSLILTRSVLRYLEGEESAPACFAKLGAAIAIAAMAELKFFFVVFVLIPVFSMVLTPPSGRKTALLVLCGGFLCLGAFWLGQMYGYFRGFLSPEGLGELLTTEHYAGREDLSRFHALSQISRTWLTGLPDRLFGLGLGNCDNSSMALFRTPFYEQYRDTHYAYFSHAFAYLETGWTGLGLYLGFFLLCMTGAWCRLRRGVGVALFCRMGVILSLICLMLTWYNTSLRTEAGFLAYFALALPLVGAEKEAAQ